MQYFSFHALSMFRGTPLIAAIAAPQIMLTEMFTRAKKKVLFALWSHTPGHNVFLFNLVPPGHLFIRPVTFARALLVSQKCFTGES
jgi:hypothetical protein